MDGAVTAARPPAGGLARAMPWVFVLIWSTGFVVARFGMPHAPPMSFLAVRYALSVACFAAWIALARAPWPRERAQVLHLAVTGLLMHAGYLGGVWSAVKAGMGAATIALIVGLQPVLTALWLTRGLQGERGTGARVAGAQWLGLALGLVGLVLVVQGKLGAGEVTPWNLALALLALLAATGGALYQKRHVAPCDVRTASLIQLAAALVVTLPFALLESERIDWHPELLAAMAWSVLVLTLGGSSLLYLLIQRGAVTAVTSLMYLVPPCTALMAWALFGEAFTLPMLVGMGLAVAGVALVTRASRA
jgi:drug/metabolite transporter (DMT)-like permease